MIIIPILFIVCLTATAYSVILLEEFLDRTLEISPPEPYLFLLRVFLYFLATMLFPITLIALLLRACYLLVKSLKKFFDGPDYYRTVLIIPVENADNLYFDDKGDYIKLENIL